MSAPSMSSFFEQLPIGAYRCNTEGRLLHVNAAFLRIHGYAQLADLQADLEMLRGAPYAQPHRRADFESQLRAHGQLSNFVSEAYRIKTGERIWLREHAHMVYGPQGEPLYYEGTIEDITQDSTTRATLLQSEALLRDLLRSIPYQVWLKDIDGVYLACNDSFASTLGALPESIIGTRDADWLPEHLNHSFVKTDHWAMHAGKTITYEQNTPNLVNPNGDVFEVIKAPMRDTDGHIIGVLGIARSIQERKEAEALLRDTTEQLELAMMGGDLGRWNHDLTRERGYTLDARACQMLGRDPQDGNTPRIWSHWIHPDDLSTTMLAMRAHLTGEAPSYQAEYRAQHVDGSWVWFSSRGKVVQFSQDGAPQRMVGTLMDITARKLAEEQLLATQAELEATLKAMPDLLFEVSAEGRYRAVHTQNTHLLDRPADQLLGRLLSDILPHDAAETAMASIREAQASGRSHGQQYSLELPSGKMWFELSVVRKPTVPGEEERFISIARDITERKNAEEAFRHLAFHDTLTGLPNRRLLTDRLQHAMVNSRRKGEHGALMFLDLDQFKQLNDTHGHEVGDLLLQGVSYRLQQSVRAVDTVARLGGDEFVVLIQELSADYEEAKLHVSAIGHKILDNLNDPYALDQLEHTATPSIGVTLFKGDTLSPQALLKQADDAMYQAKARGRNTLCFFQS